MTKKVSLAALQSARLENLLIRDAKDPKKIEVRDDIKPQVLKDFFKGSDLQYDAKTKNLVRPGLKPLSLVSEASYIHFLRHADLDQDGFLDLREAQVALRQTELTRNDLSHVDPQAFLESVSKLMKSRYEPIGKNMGNHSAMLRFEPILEYLRTSSYGIMVDQLRHADEVLPLNGLSKSAGNLLMLPPVAVKNIFVKKSDKASLMYFDQAGKNGAKEQHKNRLNTIASLTALIEKGIERGEKWALDGDFPAAVAKLEAEAQVTIRDRMAGLKFYQILTLADDAERNRQLLEFAKLERPGTLGVGSGNADRSSHRSITNYTGSVNNLYAARGILGFLISKGEVWRPYSGEVSPEMLKKQEIKSDAAGKLFRLDRAATEKIQEEARQLRIAISGAGGNFWNSIACRIPGLKISCDKWGDEARIGVPGRLLEMSLAGYFSYRGIKHVGNTWELGRIHGAGAPLKVWWQGYRPLNARGFLEGIRGERSFKAWYQQKNFFQPFQTAAMKDARTAAAAQESAALQAGTKVAKPGWVGNRAWNRVKQFAYDKTLGKLDLNPDTKAKIATTAAKAPGKGVVVLTNAMIMAGVIRATDKRTKAYFNPNDLNYELDLAKRVDPTKPDPILSAVPKK